MSGPSILFDQSAQHPRLSARQPDSYHDLALDQVVAALAAGRRQFELEPFFCTPPHSIDTITYRQEVFADLDGRPALAAVRSFAEQLHSVRGHLEQVGKLHYRYQKAAWFLDAVQTYHRAVAALLTELTGAELHSAGLRDFRDYLHSYTNSAAFTALEQETSGLQEDLAGIRYRLRIKDDRISVGRYEGEQDYSAAVEKTFQRFQQHAVDEHPLTLRSSSSFLNSVEEAVVDRLAILHPEIFSALKQFPVRWREFLDPTLGQFDREVHFYLAYLDYIAPLRSHGLPFCYPEVSSTKQVAAEATFDLALAATLAANGTAVIGNDIELREGERVLVVTGPNQGGKTTFARTFGQLHILANLGLLVPGSCARLFAPDELFTHFEREENVTDLRSKLEDDLLRVHDILGRCTGDSILVLNEVFTSTTLADAEKLGKWVLRQLLEKDLLGVYVTFVDELSRLDARVVSMMSTVDPGDPATRTYRVVRKPADGLAYALAIAEKYGVTYERVTARLNG